jgi:hypothetical protein
LSERDNEPNPPGARGVISDPRWTPRVWTVAEPEPARPSSPSAKIPTVVTFDRRELRLIFNVYGRKVAEGEWRDYAIDFLATRAVFSIFRRASEAPLFRIEKDPALARKQGAYSVVAAGGLIMKRGHELERVLEAFDRKTKFVVV